MTSTKKARCVFFILLLLLSVLLPVGCRKDRPRQAIIILLDAARPDHFSCYGYDRDTTPSIDALAEGGIVFKNCFSQATNTRAALSCLLFSRYYTKNIFPGHPSIPLTSPWELFRRFDDQSISFAKVLEHAEFLTTVISAHTWLTNKTQFAREFTECFDLPTLLEFDKKYGYPRADQVIDFTLRWLKRHSDRDFLLYLHLMDTHFPHYFEEDARKYFGDESYDDRYFYPGGYPIDPSLEFSASDVRYLNSLYDGSLHFVDREIGRLTRFLKDTGRLSDTLLIVTADHGEFLLERKGKVGHLGQWYDLVAKIPLIIYYPQKIKAGQVKAFSELVDVGPTLLELLDVKVPRGKAFDGKDQMDRAKNRLPWSEFAFSQNAIRTDRYKCIFYFSRILSSQIDFRTLQAGKRLRIKDLSGELYDIVSDPEEKENLYTSKPEIVENLLGQFIKKMRPLYRRYDSATSNTQPEFPFAISLQYFKTNLDIPEIPSSSSSEQLKTNVAPSGWLQEVDWPNFGLYATHMAKPLEVSFEVPNGEYFLSADINGSCRIDIDGQRRKLKSEKFQNRLRWKTQNVEFGPIVIINKIFSATIYPHSKKRWFGLRLFGFEPVIAGKRKGLDPDAEERLERLRTLGYIK